jgi:2-dehydropantoate 2-reductase
MNTLVVGAGSVGQVFAHHLHLGGSTVSFLTRADRASEIGTDLVLMPLNKRNSRKKPIHFASFSVLTQYSQIESQSWDQIYVCVPSTDLTTELLEGIKTFGGNATIVKIQPGLGDRNRFTKHLDESQIVSGMVSFIGYQAPLRGETVAESGMAYWIPPLVKCLFNGSNDRVRGVVAALLAGGLPARTHSDVEAFVGYVLAVEAPITAGIEAAGWSFHKFRQSRYLGLASRGVKEASEVMARYRPSKPPLFVRLVNSLTIRLATQLLPLASKFPLEAYLEHHFTKVQAQSFQHLDDYLDQGLKYDIDVSSLLELRNAIANGEAGA